MQLRAEGARYDVLKPCSRPRGWGRHRTTIWSRCWRGRAVAALLQPPDGANLLAAYNRAANILRIEERKDGPHNGPADPGCFRTPRRLTCIGAGVARRWRTSRCCDETYRSRRWRDMAALRAPLDAFFDKVTVNAPEPELRLNRLRLLTQVRATMD